MRGVIHYEDSLIAGPTIEPLDLDEVKKALRFTATSEDTLIDVWIAAARQYFEDQTGRQILTATWERWLDAFPADAIELPHPPLQSVESVIYLDANGAEQTVDQATYFVQAPQGPTAGRGRVSLVAGESWPTTTTQEKAIRIRYTAGYGDVPGDVPELVRGALYLLVGTFFRYRHEVDTDTDQGLVVLPVGASLIIRSFRETAQSVMEPRAAWAD